MEPFIVSARKYRPQTFKDVVGQQAISETLMNAIENNHLAQALLFCGPRGVGKTTCARILAKQINQDGDERQDEDYAFNIFELDAASNNSVDDIRNLIDQVRIPPQVGKYKVYIIDEVHMLSQAAFNAFLKTLEEPPKHAIFILATTEKHKIIPTILSRCQIFDFKRITVKDAVNYLKYIAEEQGIEADEDALHIIAQKADGAMRDALSIFDRVVSFSGKHLTRKAVTENLNVLDLDTFFECTDLILENRIPELLVLFNQCLAQGFEGHHFIGGLASHFRDLMVCRHESTLQLLEVGEQAKAKYAEQTRKTTDAFLLQAIDIANDCDLKYKSSRNQRLLVELSLMKLASLTYSGEKKNPDAPGIAPKLVPAREFSGGTLKSVKRVSSTPPLPEPSQAANDQAEPVSGNDNIETAEKEELQGEHIMEPGNAPAPPAPPAVKPAAQPHAPGPSTAGQVATLEEKTPEQPLQSEEEPIRRPKINLGDRKGKVSGLSLSSIQVKKEHEAREVAEVDESDLPKESFEEAAMQKHWNDFLGILEQEGRKILASNLGADTPTLKDANTIHITLPNGTMKKEIEREQGDLIRYLRRQLNNYAISLEISVNETTAKKFAFTPEEKYQKLREKNPAIDLLRKEFDLEL